MTSRNLIYIRRMKGALAGLVAGLCGAAVAFATWNVELQSLPPGCKPCTTSVCLLVACVVQWPKLVGVASFVGLAVTALLLVAIRRLARLGVEGSQGERDQVGKGFGLPTNSSTNQRC